MSLVSSGACVAKGASVSIENPSLWGSAVLVMVLAVSACGAQAADEAGRRPVENDRADRVEPLGRWISVDVDEANGTLSAAYQQAERTLTLELRLGGPLELAPAENEGEVPRRMIDVRVLDQEGQPLYLQMAGDAFMDSSWRLPVIEGIDEAVRHRDFVGMRAAAAAFANLTLPASLHDLRSSALQMADMVADLSEKPDSVRDMSGARRRLQATWVVGGSSVAYWDYRIYRKPAFFNGSPFEHSAVQLRAWNAAMTSVVFAAISCNHGACAGAAPMAVKCTMPGWLPDDGTHTRFFYNEHAITTAITSGCSTRYSAIFDNGHHVCNDDTVLQINAIKFDAAYDRAYGATGECSDNIANYWAPDCI